MLILGLDGDLAAGVVSEGETQVTTGVLRISKMQAHEKKAAMVAGVTMRRNRRRCRPL